MTKRSERSADPTIGLLLLLSGLLAGSASAHEHTLPSYVKSLGAEPSEPDAQSAPAAG